MSLLGGRNAINQQLAAVCRLAHEAADAGFLSPELAAGFSRVKGVKLTDLFDAGEQFAMEAASYCMLLLTASSTTDSIPRVRRSKLDMEGKPIQSRVQAPFGQPPVTDVKARRLADCARPASNNRADHSVGVVGKEEVIQANGQASPQLA